MNNVLTMQSLYILSASHGFFQWSGFNLHFKKGEVATVNDSVYGLVDIRERKDYGEISGRIVMIGLHGRRAKWLPLPRCAKLF